MAESNFRFRCYRTPSYEIMRAEALLEGFRFLERLAAEWETAQVCFSGAEAGLFSARLNSVLVGIGGVTQDPVMPEALRIRRFYIRPAFRRRGIGRELAATLIDRSCRASRLLVVNSGNPQASAFWERLGFVADAVNDHTHVLRVADLDAKPPLT